ncbi:hypothetical protein [Clostridium sp.]|uniref:hypothetical protein n=1 Tax=Clostridium sp. TaxID=1506 RepID=UPI002637F817|nr:hypothetical protein [Clostridium sp.]
MNLYEAPENNYILVMPDGKVVGFEDIDIAKAYVNRYYQEKLDVYSNKVDFSDFDITDEKVNETISRVVGVDEGICTIYNLEDLINSIQNSSIFEDEKNELIFKLRERRIDLNINDYQVDDILANVDEVIY